MSEYSPTTICNDALLLLGGAQESHIIEDINDTTDPTAKKCAVVYPSARDGVLVAVQPTYAMKYGACGAALSGTSIPSMADWTYAFNLPADCLEGVVAYQTDEDDRTQRYEKDIVGGRLFTDTLSNSDGDSAYLYYLWKLENVAVMSTALRWAIACEMAQRIAGVIDPRQMEYIRSRAEDALNKAILADSWLCKPEEGTYEWIDARSA